MFISAIVVAAGKGLRLSRPDSFTAGGGIPTHKSEMIESGKSKISKLLIKIDSKPVIIYSLKALSACPRIKEIILVVNPQNLKAIAGQMRKYKILKVEKIIFGGRERRDSVNKGLEAINPQADLVLIHDAARPFIDKAIVLKTIKAAERYGAAVAGVPVKSTVKSVLRPSTLVLQVDKSFDRRKLWEIQTPQVFKKEIILKAYQRFSRSLATDDAMLVEKLGKKVYIVRGSYYNIKITTPEDLVIAGAIAKRWKNA